MNPTGEAERLPTTCEAVGDTPGYLYAEARNILFFSSVRFGPHPFRYIIDVLLVQPGEPERDDHASPQTGVVAAVVLLVHVRGEIGLQDEPDRSSYRSVHRRQLGFASRKLQ